MFLKKLVVSVITIFQIYPLIGISAGAATLPPLPPRIAIHEAKTGGSPDLDKQLAAMEIKVEQSRKALGVPGMSLVIVKDDLVIYVKGLGLKDVELNEPVTPNTQFAIGSATKAFTAMSAIMSQDDGKLSLEDSPKKYLPYFKLQDPEADSKISIRDLLCHRSGLNRTDLAMVTGKLTREELIKVAGLAKPTAKFRQEFLYQNIMYAAAGEAVGKAQNSTWESVVTNRIFKPLGMDATNLSPKAMQSKSDYAKGYEYVSATRETRRLPQRDITSSAPAGAINSNANDMAKWLEFMIAGGVWNGKRLVSESGYKELVTKQMKVSESISYGLGWFLQERKGHKVIEHGGNVDGFTAEVAFMPDQKLGLAMLTNANNTPLGQAVMESVFSNLVDDPPTPTIVASMPATTADGASEVDQQKEAGSYPVPGAGVAINVVFKEGKLYLAVPGQPEYVMEKVSGRKYKLGAPAPDGFYATFRPGADPKQTELFLQQPQDDVALVRAEATTASATNASSVVSGSQQELVGSYKSDTPKLSVEIAGQNGKLVMITAGLPNYVLLEKEKDIFKPQGLPEGFSLKFKRDAAGKVNGLTIAQPQGNVEFNREAIFASNITADQLMAKMINAIGGEANIRKHKSMVINASLDYASQGVTGEAQIMTKAPNLLASRSSLTALGKEIGTQAKYFDGAAGQTESSFLPSETLIGKQLVAAKIQADFYSILDWKTLFESIDIKGKSKVGDDEVYIITVAPAKGDPLVYYVSAKSFLILKLDRLEYIRSSDISLPVTTLLEDYREVDGVMIAFKRTERAETSGDVIVRIKEVKFDADIPNSEFHPKSK